MFDINDICDGLTNICNRDIGKITDWRKYFISVPGVMDALHDYSSYKLKGGKIFIIK